MKDFLGKDLAVGDNVIMVNIGKYKGLSKGIVESFTPKMVRVTIIRNGVKANHTVNQTSNFLIKVEDREIRSNS